MVGEDAGVQHVRVRQDDMPAFSNRFARIARSVAVIGEHAETVVETSGEVLKFSQLILSEGFGWKQIQRTCIGILENGIQDRQVVTKCFAGCGWCYNDDIVATLHEFSSS